MDNIEFSVLTEVCSVNYSQLLTAVYSRYKRNVNDEAFSLQGLFCDSSRPQEEFWKNLEENYFRGLPNQNKILSILSDYDFQNHFKVSRSTVEVLIQIFEQRQSEKKWMGRPPMEVSRIVLIGLWFLVSKEPYRMLCERFSIAIGHSNQTVRFFLSVLAGVKEYYIIWPKGEEVKKTQFEFEKLFETSLPGVIGCIDSCQVRARRNKSRIFSYVIMQVVCNAKGKFTDAYCGEATKLTDSRVFRSTELGQRLLSKPRTVCSSEALLVGDNSYPLLPNLMTPFTQDQMTLPQKQFNHLLSQYNKIVVTAVGCLFGRFKRLEFLDLFKTEEVSNGVICACIIHNICIDNNDPVLEVAIDSAYTQVTNTSVIKETEGEEGVEKRENIAEELFSLQN